MLQDKNSLSHICRYIFYIELDGNATHNPETVEAVVDLMDKYDMGYGSINHTRSRCLDCGFENADADLKVCPVCNHPKAYFEIKAENY